MKKDWWQLLKDVGMYRGGHVVGDQFRKLPHAGKDPLDAMDPITMMVMYSLAQQGLPFLAETPVASDRTGKEAHSPFVVSQPLVKPLHDEWDLGKTKEEFATSDFPATVSRLEGLLQRRGGLPPEFADYKELARTYGRGVHSPNALAALTNIIDLQPRNVGIKNDGSLAIFDPYATNPRSDKGIGIANPINLQEDNQQYKYNEGLSNAAAQIAEIGRKHQGKDVHVDFSEHFPVGIELLRNLHSNLPDVREFTQAWEGNVQTDAERQQLQAMRDAMYQFQSGLGQDIGFYQGLIDQPLDRQTRLGEFGGRLFGDVEGLKDVTQD